MINDCEQASTGGLVYVLSCGAKHNQVCMMAVVTEHGLGASTARLSVGALPPTRVQSLPCCGRLYSQHTAELVSRQLAG